MTSYPEFDLGRVAPIPLRDRPSKVRVADFARPAGPGRSFREFLDALPSILAGPAMGQIAQAIVHARRQGRAVIAAIGGHVIKTGLAPVLIDLMERGHLTAIAGNGAVAVHDLEIAIHGETSEDVPSGLRAGTFGMAKETADLYNAAAVRAQREGIGLGSALGACIEEARAPYAEHSLLAAARRLRVPMTIHVAIGTDVVHMHPSANGGALGEASLRDFRILTHHMQDLADGGVIMNLGSAVVLPEVLLKAIAVLRNALGDAFTGMLGVNFDFIQQYRSNQQVVIRTDVIGGRGISLTGHHEIMIPLLAHAICEAAEDAE